MRRPLTPIAAALAAVVATAGLASCGGGDDTSTSAAAAAATPPAASSPVASSPVASSPASTPSSSPDATSATTPGHYPGGDLPPSPGTTAAGTTLKIGQSAVLDFHDETEQKAGIVTITVRSITKASMSDFKNMELDAKDKASTPYYVKLGVKNTGTTDLSGTNPQHFLSGIDDRGQEQNALLVIGTFDSCDDDTTPKRFSPGTSFDACEPFLVPGGGAITGAQWNVYDSKTNKSDVVWK